MLRTTLRAAAFALLAFALLPRSGTAQIRLIPQVGLYNQFTHLPPVGSAFQDVKKKASFAFGGAIELGQPDKVSLRLNVLHATDSEVPVGTVGCSGTDCARSTLTAATATLALRPIPNLIIVQPYLLAGGGVKRYDYTTQNLRDEGLRTLLNDQNQLTGHLGVGAEINLGLLRFTGEVTDFLSKYDDGQNSSSTSDQLQHDVFVMVGLIID